VRKLTTKYSTISVPEDIKQILEKEKGKEEWGEFILKLYTENKKLKSKKAFEKLTEILTDDDLKAISESSKDFRETFKFR
jgi:hypothetical protein